MRYFTFQKFHCIGIISRVDLFNVGSIVGDLCHGEEHGVRNRKRRRTKGGWCCRCKN